MSMPEPELSPAETTSAAQSLTSRVVDEVQTADMSAEPAPRRRRVMLPIMLLLATCASTFWVGANRWFPAFFFFAEGASLEDRLLSRQMVLTNWQEGLIYMACVLGILLAHEMGHFIATVIYRIPASLPYVIPMPLMPLGTFGAVIGMDGRRADRKQTFDIGIAGPLAGLVVCIPVLVWGIMQLDMTQSQFGPLEFHNPLLVELLMRWIQPEGFHRWSPVPMSQLNPYFMAGWVGLLVTGLNMLPVSQLDGGHVIYTLFGKRAHWIARGFMVVAVFYVSLLALRTGNPSWMLMLGLIMFVGVDHPPTRDDRVPIGWFRFVLGLLSLLIPILCFSPLAVSIVQ